MDFCHAGIDVASGNLVWFWLAMLVHYSQAPFSPFSMSVSKIHGSHITLWTMAYHKQSHIIVGHADRNEKIWSSKDCFVAETQQDVEKIIDHRPQASSAKDWGTVSVPPWQHNGSFRTEHEVSSDVVFVACLQQSRLSILLYTRTDDANPVLLSSIAALGHL